MRVVDDSEADSTLPNDAPQLLLAVIRKFHCWFMQITSSVSAH